MTSRHYTLNELRRKIDYEGGVFYALEWGIQPDDIDDPTARELWHRIEDAYNNVHPDITALEALLYEAPAEDDEW
jgi:hypothetical protein